MLPENLYFHESTVIAFSQYGAVVQLKLEGARLNDLEVSGTISFINVHDLLIDGAPSDKIGMERPDGEVLSLSCKNNVTELIVEWNDFKKKTSTTKSYVIACDSVEFVN